MEGQVLVTGHNLPPLLRKGYLVFQNLGGCTPPPCPSGSSIPGEATRAGHPLQSFRVLNPLGSWDYITIQRLFLVRKEGQTTLPRMCKA